MSDIKFIQKYESDGQGNSSLISKEELIEAIQESISSNSNVSVEEQEMIDASLAHRISLEEALKGE